MVALVGVIATTVGVLASGSASGDPVPVAARCGVERWPVKALTDPDADQVNFHPKTTTVNALRSLTRPSPLGARIPGVETTTYRVSARLIEMKLESDSDIHLVISAPTSTRRTMIVEFPSGSCTRGASTTARRKMSAARRALIDACGSAKTSSFTDLTGRATVTGVGFWDFKHGQTGVAPNAIELHPVVAFSSSNCRSA